MNLMDLPKTWRGINLKFIGKENIADVTDKYKIEFSNRNINKTVEFYVPKLEDNKFYLNGHKYIVWYRICKPIVSIEYINNIHTLFIHNILTRPDRTENYDLTFNIKDNKKVCIYKNISYDIDNTHFHDILYSYWLTNLDRQDLNEFIGSTSKDNYINKEDTDNIFNILENECDYTTNWKDILSLRVIGLEDLLISTIMCALPETLKEFYIGNIDEKVLTNNIRSFLATDTPEIRIDLHETEIASYAQNKKVILPFNNYCDVNELVPDESWYDYIDMLDTPQSIKVGGVASFINNVKIVDRKIQINNH